MIEYERHIEWYADHWQKHFIQPPYNADWGNRSLAEEYLKKYWLSSTEFEQKWRPLKEQIFRTQPRGLPAWFSAEYEMTAWIGGGLFFQKDFEDLQSCFLRTGDRQFVVIENSFYGTPQEPPLRLRYPVDISWSELTSGNYISAILCFATHKEYFVFGDSAKWGKYAASDQMLCPFNLVGFMPERRSIFREKFKTTPKTMKELSEDLPEADFHLISSICLSG